MKFELTDDAVLKMSTAMIIAHAVPCVVAPAAQHNRHRVDGTPRDKTMENWWIHGLFVNAAQGYAVINTAPTKTKKDVLKVHGAGWMAAAALDLWHAFGIQSQRPEVSIAGCVSQALLAGLCLYQGYRTEKGKNGKKGL